MTTYIDNQGRIYEARKMLGGNYATMRDGRRVKSPSLPVRDTLEAAQSDLISYVRTYGDGTRKKVLIECCPVCHRIIPNALTVCPDPFHASADQDDAQ